MAYIYAADLYCDKCGNAIKEALDAAGKRPENITDEYSWDSDDYPKYAGEDGGEADCPQHCGTCGEPLENPLTSDGVEYVLESIHESIKEAVEKGRATTWDRVMSLAGTAGEGHDYWHGQRHVEIVRGWAKQIADYNLEKDEAAIVSLFLELSEPKTK